MKAGASGFLLKAAPPARLIDAVRTVAAGEALLAPTITRRLIEEFVRRPELIHAPTRAILSHLRQVGPLGRIAELVDEIGARVRLVRRTAKETGLPHSGRTTTSKENP